VPIFQDLVSGIGVLGVGMCKHLYMRNSSLIMISIANRDGGEMSKKRSKARIVEGVSGLAPIRNLRFVSLTDLSMRLELRKGEEVR
jgi:hypothetical protein